MSNEFHLPNPIGAGKSGNASRERLSRAIERALAGIALLLSSPLFLAIALVTKLTSNSPVFATGVRVGKDGKTFEVYEFRINRRLTEGYAGDSARKRSPTPTRLGLLLRRTNLKGLPQLINVLRGEMSFIGPQPEEPRHVARYTPEQRQILAVRPGMISPGQLYYWDKRESTDAHESIYQNRILPHKVELDLAYFRHRALWTDIALLLETIVAVVTGGSRLSMMLTLRNRYIFAIDAALIFLLPAVALTIRKEGIDWYRDSNQALLLFSTIALLIKLSLFYSLGLYRRYWPYASVNDLSLLVFGIGLSTIVLTAIFVALHGTLMRHGLALYRTIPLIDGLLTFVVLGGVRFGLRGIYFWHRRYQKMLTGRRVLIVGAGEAGVLTVREIRANPLLNLEPIGFVDDNVSKVGTYIQGLPVLGTSDDLPALVARFQIEQIVVAIPSAPLARRRELVASCRATGVPTQSLPGVYEILAGHKTISQVPRIDINRILRREPIHLDEGEVAATLKGAKVLVTGAGGSIGSVLCRQIARFEPAEIVLLGHGENSIFEIGLELQLAFPNLTTFQAIVDVRDSQQVHAVIAKHRPDIIFHAAAHKHVPFMQEYIEEAVTNNVLGTQNVLRAAEKYQVDRFVLISTDKAINPANVMGATKRVAELLTLAAAQRTGRAYMAVRFGNVLGSRGSVVPIFLRQIAWGGPVTVTDPDMYRYFMTIPEAVQLVLQASALGEGGEIFILDMGEPIRIRDLAIDLIKLSGLEPERDIQILYTGARPGDKLREELFLNGEKYKRTLNDKIFVAVSEDRIDAQELEAAVAVLISLAKRMRGAEVIEQLQVIVPQYQPHSQRAIPAAVAPGVPQASFSP